MSGTDSPISSQHNLKYFNAKSKRSIKAHQPYHQAKSTTQSKDVRIRPRSVTVYLRGITLIITEDVNENAQRIEVASLTISDLFFTMEPKQNIMSLWICVGDLQLDNQMFDQGGFDFPVVLIGQNPLLKKELNTSLNSNLASILAQLKTNSLLAVNVTFENDGEISGKVSTNFILASKLQKNQKLILMECNSAVFSSAYNKTFPFTGVKDVRVTLAPVSAYIEDTYITQLLEYATSLVPPCFAMPPDNIKRLQPAPILSTVYIPDYIMIDAKILSSPLRLQNLIIDPVSILLSVHTSVRLYLALDHSPLYFGTFERRNLFTTPYRLGNALTMHYLSGAIFGAGEKQIVIKETLKNAKLKIKL